MTGPAMGEIAPPRQLHRWASLSLVMHESVLRDFFLGRINGSQLNDDLAGSIVQTSHDVLTYYVNPMDGKFQVEPSHLVKLCDAVLAGQVNPEHLEIIGYCLVVSDHFFSQDQPDHGMNLVSDTAFDWASPEMNYPLNLPMVAKFRYRLVTGNSTFTYADSDH